jgi:hypothetical protein
MANDDSDAGGAGWTLIKGGLMVLGGLAALGFAIGLFKALLGPIFLLAVVAGAGYVGYRLLGQGKALGAGKERRSLPSSDDFDRRMRELDAAEKRIDAEIRKHS